jgi:hypothetical protein
MITKIIKLLESKNKTEKVLFYIMRTVKSRLMRNLVSEIVAKRIGKCRDFEGESTFLTLIKRKEHLNNINTYGYTELDKGLSDDLINEIISYSKNLKCFDPFHKHHGNFAPENIPSDTHVANFNRKDLVKNELIRKIANDPGILNLAKDFLNATPTISNVNMWWSIGGKEQAEDAQLFHRDVDDFRFIKLFIYLTDVDENSGPHTYVRGSSSSDKLLKIRRYQDEEIHEAFGKENVIEFVRPKGTAFMVNTYGFHKGLLPKSKNRLLLQVQYSLRPIGIETYSPIEVEKSGLLDNYVNRLILKS